MARLRYVNPQKSSPEIRKTFTELPTALNVFKMMAHAETNFRPLVRLGSAILASQKLPAKLRELAILQVAHLSKARYEWVQHVALAVLTGVTRPQIEAIEKGNVTAACFNKDEQLVLAFATEVMRDVRCSDATFAKVRAKFSPQEIVELTLAVGYYMMIARLCETTGVDVEPASERIAKQAQSFGGATER